MVIHRAGLALCLPLAGLLLWGAPPARAQGVRLAVVAGNDRGSERRASLRYAERDARRVAALLVELGGFAPEGVRLLTGAGPEALLGALDWAEAEFERMGGEDGLLLVYYSGHADGLALELGSGLLPFDRLRARLEASRARVKIALVDACQSGALTGLKGGRPGPAFELPQEARLAASGTAILTSSTGSEPAQESAEVQGSYFTTYLLSGLRGAADFDRDQRVSLSEVYQYAFERTLEATSRTLAGPQHPSFELRLAGRGGVVLTELARRRAALALGPELAGEFVVLDRERGAVLAELGKGLGERRRLALPAGEYRVALRRGGRLFQAVVALGEGAEISLGPGDFRESASLVASAKGAGEPRGAWGLFAHYGLSAGALRSVAALHQGVLGLRWDLGPVSLLPRVAYGEAAVEDGLLRYRMRLVSGLAAAAWRFEISALDLFAGLGLGGAWGAQRLPDGRTLEGGLFTLQAVLGLDVPVWAGLSVQAFWLVGLNAYRQDGDATVGLALEGSLGLGYQF